MSSGETQGAQGWKEEDSFLASVIAGEDENEGRTKVVAGSGRGQKKNQSVSVLARLESVE